MTGTWRHVARTGALTAFLLLLLLPAGASAATPPGLLDQTAANVNGAVQSTGATVGQVTAEVDGVVGATAEATRQTLRREVPAAPVRGVPTGDTELGAAVDRTVAATANAVAGADLSAASDQAPAPQRPAGERREARPHDSGPAAHPPAASAVRDLEPSTSATAAASHELAGGSPPRPTSELSSTADKPAAASTAGHALGASGGGVSSAAFSAGAVGVLLAALCLAASALMTRLPRFDEVGRPLPLVFALERPG